jgi:pimeloyl-ACP methyl ester carboxylesterase
VTSLAYEQRGTGDPVLFIAGHGGAGRTWHLHQVPAFVAAGYRAITFDNRGIGATENDAGFTTQTMVSDTATLIEELGIAPCRVVAMSMGAFVAQELMLARPELVHQAALLATRGRHDRTRTLFHSAQHDLLSAGVTLPASYDAKMRLLEGFSPKTLNNDRAVGEWIDMFMIWPTKFTPGFRAQLDIAPRESRLPAYRTVTTDTLVIGFADDVVLPAYLGKEVADALPNGRYLQINDAGHLGILERPELVNAAILQFFADGRM